MLKKNPKLKKFLQLYLESRFQGSNSSLWHTDQMFYPLDKHNSGHLNYIFLNH